METLSQSGIAAGSWRDGYYTETSWPHGQKGRIMPLLCPYRTLDLQDDSRLQAIWLKL